jgi:hypothetical protein
VPGPASHRLVVLGRILLWTALGGWIGALLLCGVVVVRAAFEAVPDPGVAADLIGRVLAPLQLAGIGLGVALAALGGALRRGTLSIALPLALAGLCAANQFGIAPAVAAIDLTDPAAGADAGARFARLHQLSVGLFVATALGALLLGALHAAIELREEGLSGTGEARKKAKYS